jgi:hypothetical protein
VNFNFIQKYGLCQFLLSEDLCIYARALGEQEVVVIKVEKDGPTISEGDDDLLTNNQSNKPGQPNKKSYPGTRDDLPANVPKTKPISHIGKKVFLDAKDGTPTTPPTSTSINGPTQTLDFGPNSDFESQPIARKPKTTVVTPDNKTTDDLHDSSDDNHVALVDLKKKVLL